MCGIVAGVSQHSVIDALLEGLARLEYRGYDSCGIAFIANGQLQRLRTTERVQDLKQQASHVKATIGIAHTRWATHGQPSMHNAHPHFSHQNLALVHNGIIENYESLREKLQHAGYVFESQTDTEVLAHLIHAHYQTTKNLLEAVRLATLELRGAYSIAVCALDQPDILVGARLGSPLVLGIGQDEHFLVSDTLAIAGRCHKAIYLEEYELAEIGRSHYKIIHQQHGETTQAHTVHTIAQQSNAIELAPYAHYMQKEIFEQARAVSDTLGDLDAFSVKQFGQDAWEVFANTKQILILACGTSYYAACVAKYWLESIAHIPTQVEISSEYRYRESVPDPQQLVICISQSGETADTLAALQHAQNLGHSMHMVICNVASSAMVRQTRLHFLTKAGVEIGVASTKAFTTQLLGLAILSYTFAKQRGILSQQDEAQAIAQLRHLPNAIQSALALEPAIMAWSQILAKKEHALFLGRGMHYPIALEGALKLKEISYIHAEAYAAGELKHGPLALVTTGMPVVVAAPNNALLEKVKSNIQEVKARGGELFVLTDADSTMQAEEGIHIIRLPAFPGSLSPIIYAIPLQLLAYHTACLRGNDVDKPRNLAKSVTVE